MMFHVTPSDASPVGRFQPPEVRQRQILDAAAALAVEHGLDNVSIAQVAHAAGIAKGSIYLHYASRTELIDALQTDLWRKMLDHPNELVANDELTWTQRMDDIVGHLVEFSMENEDLYHAVFHAAGTHTDEPWTDSRHLLRHLLIGGIEAGEFDVSDVDVTADFLLHAYAGPCYHSDDRAHVADEIQQLFRRVVGAAQLD
jgi:AcrR family transcriptional regulator